MNSKIFLQLLISVLAITVLSCSDSNGKIYPDDIPGCTDPAALNYDSTATSDDGSCDYPGCTDSLAVNYDNDATVDDGNCVEASEIPAGWSLVWNDEFNGNQLDTSRWNYEIRHQGWVNNELQEYTDSPQNCYLEDGNLNIVARKANPFDPADPLYRSARLTSARKGDWLYGRFDARAKMPAGQGFWPAIWMMPTDSEYGGWPVSGEIDIMEYLGHETNRVHGTIHYGDYYPNKSSSGGSYVLEQGSFAEEFHLFSLEWEENEIRWYVDGELFYSASSWFSVSAPFPAPFDKQFYFILNLAVGGDWPGSPDVTTLFPGTLQIDYIRVFQK